MRIASSYRLARGWQVKNDTFGWIFWWFQRIFRQNSLGVSELLVKSHLKKKTIYILLSSGRIFFVGDRHQPFLAAGVFLLREVKKGGRPSTNHPAQRTAMQRMSSTGEPASRMQMDMLCQESTLARLEATKWDMWEASERTLINSRLNWRFS